MRRFGHEHDLFISKALAWASQVSDQQSLVLLLGALLRLPFRSEGLRDGISKLDIIGNSYKPFTEVGLISLHILGMQSCHAIKIIKINRLDREILPLDYVVNQLNHHPIMVNEFPIMSIGPANLERGHAALGMT